MGNTYSDQKVNYIRGVIGFPGDKSSTLRTLASMLKLKGSSLGSSSPVSDVTLDQLHRTMVMVTVS